MTFVDESDNGTMAFCVKEDHVRNSMIDVNFIIKYKQTII